MKKLQSPLFVFALLVSICACGMGTKNKDSGEESPALKNDTVQTAIGELVLPEPYATKSVSKNSRAISWPDDKTPQAPAGFEVSSYVSGFNHPRWVYIAPNGDIFVSESNTRNSANQISLLRDNDWDGTVDFRTVFIDKGLKQPFGMLVIDNSFYIACTNGLYKYPYQEGQTHLDPDKAEKIVDLPAGGYNNHWTRNIITNQAKDKIYISVGSSSNVGEHGMEHEVRRADILVVDLNGGSEEIYASGLRNPVGMDWNPANNELWTAVNERDELGDNLVPDYITSVKKGGFYGWPYSYFGQIPDPRMEGERTDLVEKAIVPDVPVGSHTASLGLAFYTKNQFPSHYKDGVFVGQHGSWNRSILAGYKVLFVPFKNGKPSGEPEDFLTGFIANRDKAEVYGRPVCVAVTPKGDLLVVDDDGNTIWRVHYSK